VQLFLRVDWVMRLAFSGIFVGAPIFFASACFALLFRSRAQADVAFGWNLLGAVAGGLLEFLSMVIGIKSLTLLALIAYLVAFLIRVRMTAATPAAAAAPAGASAVADR